MIQQPGNVKPDGDKISMGFEVWARFPSILYLISRLPVL